MDGCAVQLRTPAIFCADMRRVDPSPPRLTAGPVGIHLRSIAVPMALGFVALNSYSIADTYFVGQLGTLPLAAMSFTFPVAFAMISVGLGVGIGTSSVVARLLGTGDRATVQRITTHALILGAVAGLLLLAVGLATIEPVFRLLGADERTLPLITEYMQVYYLGSMFFILPMVGNHAIRATGDAMVPAVILSLSAVLNVVLDPILIFGWLGFPRLELRGAAIATVIANTVTVLASLTVLYRRERLILPRYLSVAGLLAATPARECSSDRGEPAHTHHDGGDHGSGRGFRAGGGRRVRRRLQGGVRRAHRRFRVAGRSGTVRGPELWRGAIGSG